MALAHSAFLKKLYKQPHTTGAMTSCRRLSCAVAGCAVACKQDSKGTDRGSAGRGLHATLLHDVHPVVPSGHPEHRQCSRAYTRLTASFMYMHTYSCMYACILSCGSCIAHGRLFKACCDSTPGLTKAADWRSLQETCIYRNLRLGASKVTHGYHMGAKAAKHCAEIAVRPAYWEHECLHILDL